MNILYNYENSKQPDVRDLCGMGENKKRLPLEQPLNN